MAHTETDIKDILDRVVKAYRYAKKDELPNYYEGYREMVNHSRDLAVHALGEGMDRLMEKKVPNETEEQRNYRLLSLEPITMPIWNRALNAVTGRVWNDSNYSITEWDEEQQEYFTKDYPVYGSLVEYFRSVRMAKKMYDPNAVMVLKPLSLPMTETEDGELVIDDREPINPVCVIYESEQVVSRGEGYVMVLSGDKSVVRYNGRMEQSGLVFEFYDSEMIWLVLQTGDKIDWTFEILPYYLHGLGEVPARPLRGVPKDKAGKVTYNSYFHPALGDLNAALFDESTLTIGKVANIYPERWEVLPKCDNMQCDGGKISMGLDDDGVMKFSVCPDCGGAGTKPHPMNRIIVTLPDRMDSPMMPPTPPAGYLVKETESVSFLRQEIELKKETAFAHLNLEVASKPNGQTATETKIDREELFSFLLRVSSEEFTELTWAIEGIGRMRNGDRFAMPVVDPPTDFTIRSYSELTEEVSKARQEGLPMVAMRRLVEEYLSARFTMDRRMTDVVDLVFYADRHIMDTASDLGVMLAQGVTSKLDVVLHGSIYMIIERLVTENPGFMDMAIDQKSEAVRQRAQELLDGMGDEGATVGRLMREIAGT